MHNGSSARSLNHSVLRQIFDRHECDKGWRHGYERLYVRLLGTIRHEELRILEVGVFRGASLAAWAEYFPNATIYGLDLFTRVAPWDIECRDHPRVHLIEGDSRKVRLGGKFDVIIDDGSHRFADQRATLENLLPLATRHYLIEDVWPLHCMSDKELQHEWLSTPGFSREEFNILVGALAGVDSFWHDLRAGHQPDSCIIEVTP